MKLGSNTIGSAVCTYFIFLTVINPMRTEKIVPLIQICKNLHEEYSSYKKKLRGLNPQANYSARATAACRWSLCQLWRIEGLAWSAQRIITAVFSVF
jgi:hypothetical protein